MVRALVYRFSANTLRKLREELTNDDATTRQGIEEATVLMHRHEANAEFYRNKVAFLTTNLDCTRRRAAGLITPTADGES